METTDKEAKLELFYVRLQGVQDRLTDILEELEEYLNIEEE